MPVDPLAHEQVHALELDGEYEFTLRVRARVASRYDSHGPCFFLELERRDYAERRCLLVDEDEIVSYSPLHVWGDS